MKHRLIIISLLSLALVSGNVSGVHTQIQLQQATASREVLVDFDQPIPLSDLGQMVDSYGVRPLEIRFEADIQDGTTHSGGYFLSPGQSVASATDAMIARHRQFIDEALAVTEDLLRTEGQTDVAQGIEKLHHEFVALRRQPWGELKVSGIRVRNGNALQKMVDGGRVSNISPQFLPGEKTGLGNSPNIGFASPQAIAGNPAWAPYRGSSKVNQSLAFNIFYFNANRFASDATYEHETQIYTSGNTHYAYFDNYWASNMPRPYSDTPFADSIFNPTIGSAQASALLPETQYYTSIGLRPGNVKTATVRIKGQRGQRIPGGCYSTWCAWPKETSPSLITFQAPQDLQIKWQ